MAIISWLIALLCLFGYGYLPTPSNKIRQRDSHYLVQNFREHQADILALGDDFVHPSKGDLWRMKCGSSFHWDGNAQVYKDGRIDIELLQEIQGFNGQVFVCYTKAGKDAFNGDIVEDLEKDYGKSYEVYQPLGDGWYIWYFSS
ncbi:MAG TPA: hypothetical protein VK731_13380 [Candidatus Cybelea sp.]|nr:hypothetical protein [Candidatus Cybelea sp.]